MTVVIERPYCDWVALPFKDKRKAPYWFCKECEHRGRGRKPPSCPCTPIELAADKRGMGT